MSRRCLHRSLFAPPLPPSRSWDRNTYQAHAWDPTNLETLPITMNQNLMICNYNAFFPIDNDDGSNAYVQTRNFLLWGGAKSLMGYNKAFLGNTFVYVDYTPVTTAAVRALQLPSGEGTPAMQAKYPRALSSQPGGGLGSGNGYGSCTSSIAPWPSANLDLADQFRNNTCIATSKSQFYDWCVRAQLVLRARPAADSSRYPSRRPHSSQPQV